MLFIINELGYINLASFLPSVKLFSLNLRQSGQNELDSPIERTFYIISYRDVKRSVGPSIKNWHELHYMLWDCQ